MKLLRIILLPFVPLYFLIVAVRNFLFNKKIFKSKSVSAKVISVGNITVGGSGKTPAVIYITNTLKDAGKLPGVLSRGYSRNSSGYVFVSDGKEFFTTVDVSGDEIYHTVLDCQVPAAVCENRVEGAEKLISDSSSNVIVLDDAFQHRWIERESDIVVIDQRFITGNNFFINNLLPSGNMREPFSSLKRADAIIINRKFAEKRQIPANRLKYFKSKKIFYAYYKAISFIDLKKKTEYDLTEFEGQKSLVVSGVAKPISFLNVLRQTNVDTQNQLIFRDHKKYTNRDVQIIRKKFYSTNSHSVVTTEKDAVKLTNFSKELDDIDIFYLKIKLNIDNEESFKKFLVQ